MNENSLPEMRSFWNRLGYDVSDLNRLKIIHVAGTKGKGSTSAFIESILSKSTTPKLKVGFYSSPHLVEVRERIRVNGTALDKNKFSEYFFEVWDRLNAKQPAEIPSYFRFLTLMAFHVFLKEKVDVAIVEVGIGGTFDATNIIERPGVCAITSLGFDHQALLGNTLEEIASHKAGIMKSGVPCVTTNKNDGVLSVLEDRAKESGAELIVAEEFLTSKGLSTDQRELGINGDHQITNANIALTVSILFAKNHELALNVQDAFSALSQTEWKGRTQILQDIVKKNTRYYIDGAHTIESLQVCKDWFLKNVRLNNSAKLYLIFCVSGKRDATSMLNVFKDIPFETILLPVNKIEKGEMFPDLQNNMVDFEEETSFRNKLLQGSIGNAKAVIPMKSIDESVEYVRNQAKDSNVDVLVTGSLHLVGSFFAVLENNKS